MNEIKPMQKEVLTFPFLQGTGSTLVGVHGAGSMLFFGKLARKLSHDHAFCVMQARNMDSLEHDHHFEDIQDLTMFIADQIEALDRTDALFICGRYGPIVLEVGQRLRERGIKVDALIIFDSTGPSMSQSISTMQRGRSLLLKPLRNLLGIPVSMGIVDWWKTRSNPASPSTEPYKYKSFGQLNHGLLQHYQPARYPGKIILIRSEQFSKRKSKRKQIQRWRHITDSFECYVISGTHWTMFSPPHVSALAGLLGDILDGNSSDQLQSKWAADSLVEALPR